MEIKCRSCGKHKKFPPSRKQIYCSQKCYSSDNRMENNRSWRGGKCKSLGYIIIRKPNHPFCSKNGYVREHRLVMEKKLCRYLRPEEIVHHINGIKDDNRIENLVVMTQSEHKTLHSGGRKPCKIKDCKDLLIAKGYCEVHYRRYTGRSKVPIHYPKSLGKQKWKTISQSK